MKRVFVCSPLSADDAEGVARNQELAREHMLEVLRAGGAPMVPHLLYPQVLDDRVPEDRRLGLDAGLAWLLVCDEVWVWPPSWRQTPDGPEPILTSGMAEEVAAARRVGLPVLFMQEPTAEGHE